MKHILTFILTLLLVVIISGCKTSNSKYSETDRQLTGLTIYEYTSNQENCPTWAYEVLFETEDYLYVYNNQCPTAHFILEDNVYLEIVQYIESHDLSNSDIEDSDIGRKIMK